MKKKIVGLKRIVGLYAFLFVVWGFYRLLFQFPEPLDELVIKPIVWLGPVAYLLYKEKSSLRSVGITLENIFPSIYFALALGSIFVIEAMVVNFMKYKGLNFAANIGENSLYFALFLSFATAISEEITFRGYIFGRTLSIYKNEVIVNIVTSLGWTAIHMPIAIFDWHLDTVSLILYAVLTTIFAFGASFVYVRTKNILSPILLHVFWQWPIILFR